MIGKELNRILEFVLLASPRQIHYVVDFVLHTYPEMTEDFKDLVEEEEKQQETK